MCDNAPNSSPQKKDVQNIANLLELLGFFNIRCGICNILQTKGGDSYNMSHGTITKREHIFEKRGA